VSYRSNICANFEHAMVSEWSMTQSGRLSNRPTCNGQCARAALFRLSVGRGEMVHILKSLTPICLLTSPLTTKIRLSNIVDEKLRFCICMATK